MYWSLINQISPCFLKSVSHVIFSEKMSELRIIISVLFFLFLHTCDWQMWQTSLPLFAETVSRTKIFSYRLISLPLIGITAAVAYSLSEYVDLFCHLKDLWAFVSAAHSVVYVSWSLEKMNDIIREDDWQQVKVKTQSPCNLWDRAIWVLPSVVINICKCVGWVHFCLLYEVKKTRKWSSVVTIVWIQHVENSFWLIVLFRKETVMEDIVVSNTFMSSLVRQRCKGRRHEKQTSWKQWRTFSVLSLFRNCTCIAGKLHNTSRFITQLGLGFWTRQFFLGCMLQYLAM